MGALSDPVIWLGMVLLLTGLVRAGKSLSRDLAQRRNGQFLRERHVRMLIVDYRARYGPREGAMRLQKDLEATKLRVEGLAARWKRCQKEAEEALEGPGRRSLQEEERRAYQAFLAEASRLKVLKEAGERLRH